MLLWTFFQILNSLSFRSISFNTLITIWEISNRVWLLRFKRRFSSNRFLSKLVESLIMSFLWCCTSFWLHLLMINSDFFLFNLNLFNNSLFDSCYLKLWLLRFRTFKWFFNFTLLFINHWRGNKTFTLYKLLIWFTRDLWTICLLPISLSWCSTLSWILSVFENIRFV